MLFSRQKPWPRSRVAWWPGGRTATKAASAFAPLERFDRDETAAGRERGGVERAGRHGRVGVEVAAARSREPLDRLEVAVIVDAREVAS